MSKTLIIGIDGGTWTILRPAMDDGFMPNLKSLVDSGVSGPLESTTPPKTPAAWSAFQTGSNPGKTGIYDFASWDKKNKKNIWASSASLPVTLWELAGNAGKTVAVVNVPMTYPPRPVNGCMVTGILTPSLDNEFTYPPELKTELIEAVPGYHIFNISNIKSDLHGKDFKSFVARMAGIIDNRTKAGEFIIDKYKPDLCMLHFQASDVIQHAMWGAMSQGHSLFDKQKRDYILENFYRPLDEKIGQIIKKFKTLSKDTAVFLISDHGFQTHLKRVNLGNWLVNEGYLVLGQPPKSDFKKFKNVVRESLKKLTGQKTAQPVLREIWADSRIYSFSRGNDGFVFLLEDDKDKRNATEKEFREKLSQVTDPETGSPVVHEILSRDQVYHGDKLDLMPDLIVKPADGYSFTGSYLPGEEGLFHVVTAEKDFHVGMHHKDGIFVGCGKGINAGVTISDAKLIDIAPTILSYLSVDIPKNMDGKVLTNIFSDQVSAKYTEIENQKKTENTEYSDEESRQIEQRLRGLGYMD